MSAILKVKTLTKNFGGLKAVYSVDLDVQADSITGLIGPNGAGKTTFFNCVTSLHAPDGGSIIYAGNGKETDITGMKPHKIAGLGVARTFQNIRLFDNMTVLENVMTGMYCRTSCGFVSSIFAPRKSGSEDAFSASESRRLLEFAGILEHAGKNAGSLSHGLQRRLEIARALALRPKLLLLDEPAGGMNPAETLGLMNLMLEIRKSGTTVFLIEHDMKVVMSVSDRIAVLNYGEKIAEGTPEEIRNNEEVVSAYLGGERVTI